MEARYERRYQDEILKYKRGRARVYTRYSFNFLLIFSVTGHQRSKGPREKEDPLRRLIKRKKLKEIQPRKEEVAPGKERKCLTE